MGAPERMLYFSGQVATDGGDRVMGEGDMGAQTEQTLRNIATVLGAAGTTFDDIVAITVFVTDMKQLGAIHEVRCRYFKPPYPASTLVEAKSLVDPRLMIEINAVAMVAG